ncbi:hypothetical protein N7474_009710 [Penicillium riverlandense]|uniref:uncharacterized protein n=1 Tax=Penicillium riverlandense TaxID=1903569 RepID=UPI0025467684|nr:uncharacterized protein N7474_009710 [Penicillium riverlandense]KAJ5808441.1 hypothetical protein N7474_009710 [Penicillium riverlandense]
MGHTVTQLPWPQAEAKQAGDRPADVEAEANKQRRKVQNRKNQRAHRLRLKSRASGTVQRSRPFQVSRWRLDEPDHRPTKEISLVSERATTTHFSPRPRRTYTGISPSTAERSIVRGSPPTAHLHPALTLEPQPFTFPLSLDHLLHLIHYNVFRALMSNKRTLNTLSTDPTICTLTSPCRDDTTLYPLKPDIPSSLVPTSLQQTRYHSSWINVIPFPRVRDNLIRCEGCFDPWELMQDLVGELMSSTPAPRQRGTPGHATVPETGRLLTLSSGSDTDEVTAGRKGLIVWGEPHEMQSWEATPGFLAKWTWAVEGCEELVEISNHWRMKRGRNLCGSRCRGAIPHHRSRTHRQVEDKCS